VYIICLCVYIL